MPLMTTKPMFDLAYECGFAVGAFNVNNMEITQGIIEAAAAEKRLPPRYQQGHRVTSKVTLPARCPRTVSTTASRTTADPTPVPRQRCPRRRPGPGHAPRRRCRRA